MVRTRGRRKKNYKKINQVCAEIAEQFTHADVVSFEEMYSLIVSKYGGEPPSIPNVLRLCVRHDTTRPPLLKEGATFSSFVEEIQKSQTSNDEFYAKWRVKNKQGKIIELTKATDLSKKNYALICFSDRWKRMWEKCKVKPEIEKYTEFDYKLGTYPGAWADYEEGR